MPLYQCIKFHLLLPSILLEICSGQKCDGQTDEQSGAYTLSFREAWQINELIGLHFFCIVLLI